MAEPFYNMWEQPGSGVIYGNNKIEYIFKGPSGAGALAREEIRKMAISDTRFRGLFVDFESSKLSPDGKFDTLFVVVDTTPNREVSTKERADGETEWKINHAYEIRAMELFPGYRTHWNHDLYFACEATKDALEKVVFLSPAWWLTAKDTNLSPKDQLLYKWAQSQPPDSTIKENGVSKTFRWLLLLSRTRKGREGYPITMPSVTEKIYFRTFARAVANLKKANTHVAPSVTGPYSKDPKHWLLQPDGIEETANYFVTVNHYIYADKWDNWDEPTT